MSTFTPKFLIRTLAVTFTLLTGSQAFAASACKGQTDTACNQNDSCYWVTGYKRSDGANVKGHCRAKPHSSIKDSSKKKMTKESAEMNTTKKNKVNAVADPKASMKKINTKTEKNTTTKTQ